MTKATKPRTVPLGGQVEIEGPSGYVCLPDGTTVTCRSSYTVRHVGEHRIGDLVFIGVSDDDKGRKAPENK